MRHLRVAVHARVSALTCDRCGKEVDANDPAAQDFLSIDRIAGYGSVFGDGAAVELDLCESCFQAALGPWVRVSDGPLTKSLASFDPARHGGEAPAEPMEAPLHQSRPHEETVIAALARDPEYATEYLKQVVGDGDVDEVRLAVRRLAVCGLLHDADAKYLLLSLTSLRREGESSLTPPADVFKRLRTKAAAARSRRAEDES